MQENVDAEHEHETHDGHHTSKFMVAMMLGCVAIGVAGIWVRSFYLDVAFVLTMGFCIGHHLWHRFRARKHGNESREA